MEQRRGNDEDDVSDRRSATRITSPETTDAHARLDNNESLMRYTTLTSVPRY